MTSYVQHVVTQFPNVTLYLTQIHCCTSIYDTMHLVLALCLCMQSCSTCPEPLSSVSHLCTQANCSRMSTNRSFSHGGTSDWGSRSGTQDFDAGSEYTSDSSRRSTGLEEGLLQPELEGEFGPLKQWIFDQRWNVRQVVEDTRFNQAFLGITILNTLFLALSYDGKQASGIGATMQPSKQQKQRHLVYAL